MNPLTEKQIRASFVNASKREAAQATLPDLDTLAWDRLDDLGWRGRQAPLRAYAGARAHRRAHRPQLRAAALRAHRDHAGARRPRRARHGPHADALSAASVSGRLRARGRRRSASCARSPRAAVAYTRLTLPPSPYV